MLLSVRPSVAVMAARSVIYFMENQILKYGRFIQR
jgi:hypothetical protein